MRRAPSGIFATCPSRPLEGKFMKVIAPRSYSLRVDEKFTIVIECVGTAYGGFGDVNGFDLGFKKSTPAADVTPALLKGPHSVNHVFLHAVYQKDATPHAEYTIRVLDEKGAEQDRFGSKIDPSEPLPYVDDFSLRVQVE